MYRDVSYFRVPALKCSTCLYSLAVNATLTGRVVRRGDLGYDDARRGWNQLHSAYPEAIVFCGETADAVNALVWALETGVPVRVRSGRHCLEGWSAVDDGVVIDVSAMKSVVIDADAQLATVGAGLTQLEAVTALSQAGFATPTGTEGTVGLAGATLGGGFGLLTRRFGMACDNLMAAEVVVASPPAVRTLVVDDEHHSELLWALRGAGNGSFGIVTSLTYRIHPMPQPVFVTATWAGSDDLAEIFDQWQTSAPHTDPRLTSQLEIHREETMLSAVLTAGSPAEALDLLGPILTVGAPTVGTEQTSWGETYAGLQIPLSDEAANWKFSSQFVSEPFPPDAVAIVRSFMSRAPTPDCNYFSNAFGGAVTSSEPPGGSAFAHRNALFYAEPGAGWGVRDAFSTRPDPLDAACQNWVTEFTDALRPYVDGAYVNVPNPQMPQWDTAYWGSNVTRLRSVKATYDPANVFTYQQAVLPLPA